MPCVHVHVHVQSPTKIEVQTEPQKVNLKELDMVIDLASVATTKRLWLQKTQATICNHPQ